VAGAPNAELLKLHIQNLMDQYLNTFKARRRQLQMTLSDLP
jgi:hypothetical protein